MEEQEISHCSLMIKNAGGNVRSALAVIYPIFTLKMYLGLLWSSEKQRRIQI